MDPVNRKVVGLARVIHPQRHPVPGVRVPPLSGRHPVSAHQAIIYALQPAEPEAGSTGARAVFHDNKHIPRRIIHRGREGAHPDVEQHLGFALQAGDDADGAPTTVPVSTRPLIVGVVVQES